MKLLQGQLPLAPKEYNPTQFNQLIHQLQLVLQQELEDKKSADDKEAIDFFLAK